jgi:hypothetical protein
MVIGPFADRTAMGDRDLAGVRRASAEYEKPDQKSSFPSLERTSAYSSGGTDGDV